MATGNPAPFDVALRRHLVRAEPFLAIDQGGNDGPSTASATSRDNFFLLEMLKRLAPERVDACMKTNSVDDSFSANPEP